MATAGTHYKTFSQIFYDGLVHPSSIGYFAGRPLQADAFCMTVCMSANSEQPNGSCRHHVTRMELDKLMLLSNQHFYPTSGISLIAYQRLQTI